MEVEMPWKFGSALIISKSHFFKERGFGDNTYFHSKLAMASSEPLVSFQQYGKENVRLVKVKKLPGGKHEILELNVRHR